LGKKFKHIGYLRKLSAYDFLTIFLFLTAIATSAHSSNKNLLELDPNIIAAANCNGAL